MTEIYCQDIGHTVAAGPGGASALVYNGGDEAITDRL